MGRAGPRFSYANVMSTLAVFLALGGSAYAVSQINGKRLKPHSVAASKLQDDSITGKQVRESTLGEVSSAHHSASAHRAHVAQRADKATRAGIAQSARNSQTAATANNALQLGGLTPSSFERSGRVLYGSGRIDAPNSQQIFSSSAANFELTTDGDTDRFTQLRLKNDNSAGNLIGTVYTRTGTPAAFGVSAGSAEQIGPASGAGTDYLDTLITNAGKPGESVWVHCLFNPTGGVFTAFCWGVQASAP